MEILEAVQQAGHKADPLTHTKRPIVTGTSVLGIQYKDGVMLAADTLGSYGSLARFKDLRRIRKVGARTLVGASGEYSDFQHILQMLEVHHFVGVDRVVAVEPFVRQSQCSSRPLGLS